MGFDLWIFGDELGLIIVAMYRSLCILVHFSIIYTYIDLFLSLIYGQ